MKNKQQKPNTKPHLWLGIILAITFLSYSNSFNNELLNFDDNEYFENYPEIVNLSWPSVVAYFSNYYVLMYHPLPILTFAIQYNVSGLDPFPFHLFNFLFHVINVLLVYVLIKKIVPNTTGALLATFLFAVHPMNVEAVSWISARSSVMFGCFFLASLVFYVSYIQQNKSKWLIISLLFFILSCLSKANAVTLSVVLLVFDWFYNRKCNTKLFLEKLPFFAISLLFGIITLNNEGTTKNIGIGTEMFNIFDNIFIFTYSLSFYIFKFIAPINLSAIYTYPLKLNNFLPFFYYASPIFLAVLAFLFYKLSKHNRLAIFAPLFFLVVISITLQIIPSRLFMAADRYCYLPYIGFLILIASYFNHSKWSLSKKQGLLTVGILFGLLFSTTTFARNKVWKNTLSLVNDIIDKNDNAPYLSRAYGTRAIIKSKQLNDRVGALQDYNKALELRPDEALTHYNKGIILFEMNRFSEAITSFNAAIKLEYEYFDLYNYMGLAYYQLKDYEKAISHYKKCISLKEDFPLVYNNLGAALATVNRYDEAKEVLQKAMDLKPGFIDAYKNRGIIYLRENNRQKACEDLLRVKALGSSVVDELIKSNNCQ